MELIADSESTKKWNTITFEKTKLSGFNKFITFLLFFDWLTYENLILLEPEFYVGQIFLVVAFSFKLIFPFAFLAYTGLPSLSLLKKARVGIYIVVFFAFLFWSLFPTLLGGDIISWVKLIPVFVLFIAVLSFFSKYPAAFLLFAKCLVLYVISALLQYLCVYIFGYYDLPTRGVLAGPFGIFGNVISQISAPDFHLLRLNGFWKEPSNAAGSAFSAFFLARYLYAVGERPFWRIASYLCLISGFLTLSNAGYLAIGATLLIGLFIQAKQNFKGIIIKTFLITPVIAVMLWFALFSRSYFANHGSEYRLLLAISGIRHDVNDDFDPTDGRKDLLTYTFDRVNDKIIGYGVQVTGPTGLNSSASAPLLWLLLTGYPGLLLLLLREAVLLVSLRKMIKRNPELLFLSQALLVVIVQHSVYGNWMNPNYLIFAAAVLIGFNFENSTKIFRYQR